MFPDYLQLLVSFLNSISCCAAFLFVETPRHVRHLFSNYKKSATCRMLLFPIEKRNIPLSFSPFLPFHSISSQMDCQNYTNITTVQALTRTAYPQSHSPRPITPLPALRRPKAWHLASRIPVGTLDLPGPKIREPCQSQAVP